MEVGEARSTPHTCPTTPDIRDAAERAGSGCAKRAISLVARCFSLHGIFAVFYEDRRPALLLYNGMETSKAAVLSRATATANAAMANFMAAHYKSKLRQGRVRTPPDTDTGSNPNDGTSATSPPANDDDGAGSPLRPTPPPANDDDDVGSPLRPPDLYCLDHDRRVVVPIEFTVSDETPTAVPLLDANMPSVIRGSYGTRVPR